MQAMFLEGLRNATRTPRENCQWSGQDLTRVRVQSVTTATTCSEFTGIRLPWPYVKNMACGSNVHLTIGC